MSKEIYPLHTEIIRLDEGDRYVLTVGADGMPVWWPNLYCTIALRPTCISLSTMQGRMSAICLFLNWCAQRDIPIVERIQSFDLLSMEETGALRKELRRFWRNSAARGDGPPTSRVVCNAHWRARLWAVNDYITWQASHVISRMSARDERLPEARKRLAELPNRLIGDIRTHRNTSKEGLDDETDAAFLRAISPGDPTNPFYNRNQDRNHGIWRLYHDGGVRLSEAILLKCEDLHLNGPEPYVQVERRPDDLADPRAQEPHTKTQPYPVSLTPETAKILSDYMTLHRPGYPGAKKSPYVFFSQKGKPLSIGAVVGMYRQLRAKVPALKALKDKFSTHTLRRTWNDRFGDAVEELGIGQDLEKQIRNRSQGWTRTSDQSFNYQRRRLRRKGNVVGLKMQEATKARRTDG
jgi:integrase